MDELIALAGLQVDGDAIRGPSSDESSGLFKWWN